jgi:hypothetical protein
MYNYFHRASSEPVTSLELDDLCRKFLDVNGTSLHGKDARCKSTTELDAGNTFTDGIDTQTQHANGGFKEATRGDPHFMDPQALEANGQDLIGRHADGNKTHAVEVNVTVTDGTDGETQTVECRFADAMDTNGMIEKVQTTNGTDLNNTFLDSAGMQTKETNGRLVEAWSGVVNGMERHVLEVNGQDLIGRDIKGIETHAAEAKVRVTDGTDSQTQQVNGRFMDAMDRQAWEVNGKDTYGMITNGTDQNNALLDSTGTQTKEMNGRLVEAWSGVANGMDRQAWEVNGLDSIGRHTNGINTWAAEANVRITDGVDRQAWEVRHTDGNETREANVRISDGVDPSGSFGQLAEGTFQVMFTPRNQSSAYVHRFRTAFSLQMFG